jgi:ABC-type Fe3+ transport system substrate-binding protein
MKKRAIILSLTIILATLVIPSVFVTVRAQTTELRILSPHWEGILKEYEAVFESMYPEVDVVWTDLGGTSDIVKFIDSEFTKTPEGIGWDLFWGGGVDPFIDQAEKDHLEGYQVPSEILDEIPASLGGVPMYDDINSPPQWYGSALSGFGIIYNKAILAAEGLPEPSTWEDLTEPEVKGWVSSADPRHSGSTHMAYEIMLQAYGWEKGLEIATLLGANVKSWPQSSSAVPTAVGSGDVAYGLAIDFYAWSEVDRVGADKIGYVMPEGLTVINPDSIAILKGAPNLEVAQNFVDFVLSSEGQKLWMLPVGAEGGPTTYLLGRLCVMPDLYDELANETIVPINPFTITSTLEYNATLGSDRYGLVNDLLGALIIDSHTDLVSAWSAIIETNQTLNEAGVSSNLIDQAISELGSAPLTETQALALNWSDPEVQNTYISDWHTFAPEKYSDAIALSTSAGAELVETLRAEAQSNLMMGLGGGIVIGIVAGVAIAYGLMRRRETAAIRG